VTIFVDTLVAYSLKGKSAQVQRTFATGSCHLFTDGDLSELHAMAKRLGMKTALDCPKHHPETGQARARCRCWLHDDVLPHYDLNAARRVAAVAAGAVECECRHTARTRRAWRARKSQ
jgi:hypothetical protein